MIILDEKGRQCPIPVIEAKKAVESAREGEVVSVVVDNEIAVQNLQKMAGHLGLTSSAKSTGEREFTVEIIAGGAKRPIQGKENSQENQPEIDSCDGDGRRKHRVVVISSDCMGYGEEALGKLLLKGFVYALSQQEELPETILLYNKGAFLSCKGSDSLGDLQSLESCGVEILTCGTCLDFYGLKDKLAVGAVTNMYEIVEKQTNAVQILRP